MVKRKGLPEWGEFVLCTAQRITPYAAWCRLDEYAGVEGMIHVSEVAGKWVHDIKDFVKLNKQYVAKVVKIDYQKGFVNLSLKRVTKVDKREKLNAFHREQRAEKILEQIAHEAGKSLDEAYEEVGYLLQDKFGELFSAFEEARKSPDVLKKYGISDKWIKAIATVTEKLFVEKETTIKAELELKSYAKDGVEKIKDVLNELEKTGATVKYISAPVYHVELTTKDPKTAGKKLVEALENAVKSIKQSEGEGSYELIKR